ncbi:MAG: ABC transporter permease [Dehalococcoidia bacterium]
MWQRPAVNLQQLGIPALILGFRLSAVTMRMVRSSTLEVLREDYIRTAWGEGLRERTVMARHVIKNAFIPVITTLGNQMRFAIGGTIVLETVFSCPASAA